MVTGDANKILKIPGYGLEPGCRANLLIIDARDARDAIRLCPPRGPSSATAASWRRRRSTPG